MPPACFQGHSETLAQAAAVFSDALTFCTRAHYVRAMIELVPGTTDTSAAARIGTTVRRWIVIEPEGIEHSRATIPMFQDWLALVDGEPVGVGSCSLNLGMEEDTAAFAT